MRAYLTTMLTACRLAALPVACVSSQEPAAATSDTQPAGDSRWVAYAHKLRDHDHYDATLLQAIGSPTADMRAYDRLIDSLYEDKRYAAADALLEHAFVQHPSGPWLPQGLLKWVLVAYRMGDHEKARRKCEALIFQYPDTPYAQKARAVLPKLDDGSGAVEQP